MPRTTPSQQTKRAGSRLVGANFQSGGSPGRSRSKAYTATGCGVCRNRRPPATRGFPSCARSDPVAKVQSTLRDPTFDLEIWVRGLNRLAPGSPDAVDQSPVLTGRGGATGVG